MHPQDVRPRVDTKKADEEGYTPDVPHPHDDDDDNDDNDDDDGGIGGEI
jgi:hypothetical protein